jgi:hypothetical protein
MMGISLLLTDVSAPISIFYTISNLPDCCFCTNQSNGCTMRCNSTRRGADELPGTCAIRFRRCLRLLWQSGRNRRSRLASGAREQCPRRHAFVPGVLGGARYGVTCIKPTTCRKRSIADHALRAAGCLRRRWRGTSTTARRVVVNAGSLSLRRRRRTAEAPGGACGPGASPGACCNDAARALLVKVDSML